MFATAHRLIHGTAALPAAAIHHWRISVPFLLTTAALAAAVDTHVSGSIHSVSLENRSRTLSNDAQNFGEPILTVAAAVAIARCLFCAPTGRTIATTAVSALYATAAVQALKYAFGRERPYITPDSDGSFFQHGNSFPSGHTMVAFDVASTLAHLYPRHPWVRWAAYSLATTIALARITGKEHFPSDVFFGAGLGYLAGACATGRPFC